MNLEQLKEDLKTQKEIFERNQLMANKAVNDIPEGPTKEKLKSIMNLAKAGKINGSNVLNILEELKEIQKNGY